MGVQAKRRERGGAEVVGKSGQASMGRRVRDEVW
jgi:hypothetical protein